MVRPSSRRASQLGGTGGVSCVGGDSNVAVSADTGNTVDTGEAAVHGIFNVASGDVIEATLLVLVSRSSPACAKPFACSRIAIISIDEQGAEAAEG